eukprot:m51a1_g9182 hypothetical protein (271) ;mRNA; r:58948-61116
MESALRGSDSKSLRDLFEEGSALRRFRKPDLTEGYIKRGDYQNEPQKLLAGAYDSLDSSTRDLLMDDPDTTEGFRFESRMTLSFDEAQTERRVQQQLTEWSAFQARLKEESARKAEASRLSTCAASFFYDLHKRAAQALTALACVSHDTDDEDLLAEIVSSVEDLLLRTRAETCGARVARPATPSRTLSLKESEFSSLRNPRLAEIRRQASLIKLPPCETPRQEAVPSPLSLPVEGDIKGVFAMFGIFNTKVKDLQFHCGPKPGVHTVKL